MTAVSLRLGRERLEVIYSLPIFEALPGWAKTMSPEEVVSMLNTYLSIMIERVMKKKQRYSQQVRGDNIMGVWKRSWSWTKDACQRKSALEAQQAITKRQQEDFLARVNLVLALIPATQLRQLGSIGRAEYRLLAMRSTWHQEFAVLPRRWSLDWAWDIRAG